MHNDMIFQTDNVNLCIVHIHLSSSKTLRTIFETTEVKLTDNWL